MTSLQSTGASRRGFPDWVYEGSSARAARLEVTSIMMWNTWLAYPQRLFFWVP